MEVTDKPKRLATCHPDRGHFAKGLCRPCYDQQWRAAHPGHKRNWDMRTLYGIEPEEYDFLLAVQGGACAICRTSPGSGVLHVDHDHDTEAIRGLLCGKCNKGIGLLGDSVEGVERALKYLDRAI